MGLFSMSSQFEYHRLQKRCIPKRKETDLGTDDGDEQLVAVLNYDPQILWHSSHPEVKSMIPPIYKMQRKEWCP